MKVAPTPWLNDTGTVPTTVQACVAGVNLVRYAWLKLALLPTEYRAPLIHDQSAPGVDSGEGRGATVPEAMT